MWSELRSSWRSLRAFIFTSATNWKNIQPTAEGKTRTCSHTQFSFAMWLLWDCWVSNHLHALALIYEGRIHSNLILKWTYEHSSEKEGIYQCELDHTGEIILMSDLNACTLICRELWDRNNHVATIGSTLQMLVHLVHPNIFCKLYLHTNVAWRNRTQTISVSLFSLLPPFLTHLWQYLLFIGWVRQVSISLRPRLHHKPLPLQGLKKQIDTFSEMGRTR